MDLQAILAASDSSEEDGNDFVGDGGGGGGGGGMNRYHGPYGGGGGGRGSSSFDQETNNSGGRISSVTDGGDGGGVGTISSSNEDISSGGAGLISHHSTNMLRSSHAATTATTSSSMDLEQILREDDDDDSSGGAGGGNNVYISTNNSRKGPHRRHDSLVRSEVWKTGSSGSDEYDYAYHHQQHPRHHHQQVSQQQSTSDSFASSHNAEDWAVLQAILQDGGDDDDVDDEDYGGDNSSSNNNDDSWLDTPYGGATTTTTTASSSLREQQHRIHVDEILRSEDEDDLENDILNTSTAVAVLEEANSFPLPDNDLAIDSTTTNLFLSPPGKYGITAFDTSSSPAIYNSAMMTSATLQMGPGSAASNGYSAAPVSPPRSSYAKTFGTSSPVYSSSPRQQQSPEQHKETSSRLRKFVAQSEEWLDEETSMSRLAHAQSYERKLLHKKGHGEIVSPLTVKRRLKPKIELSSRETTTTTTTTTAASLQNDSVAGSNNNDTGTTPGNNTTDPSTAGNNQQDGRPATTNSRRHHHHQRSERKKKPKSAAERLAASVMPRFNFSGIVENKCMADISQSMSDHAEDTYKVHCGLPTCLAFNSKFIAVGTQLGFILLYDLFEVLRQRLSASSLDDHYGAKKAGPITSLDLSYNGDVVVAGYASGLLLLWDTIKGTVLRSVTDTHPSPITSVRFLNDLKMVTVDAGGLVNKLTFSRNILWSSLSMETDCLLDGTAGQILAMNVLPPFSTVNPLVRPDSLAPVLRNLTLIALSSERSSFVVAVDPAVNVLHRWARPPPEKVDPLDTSSTTTNGTDSLSKRPYLPCLAWGWALSSGGGNVVLPALARSWGCCLQILCASFPSIPTSEEESGAAPQMHWPAFGEHEEIDTVAPVVALEWLNDRSLAFLTVTNEFSLVDTVMMTLLERLDFSGLRLVYAEFTLSRTAPPPSETATTDPSSSNYTPDNNDSSSCATTFQNSLRCSDDRLMALCRDEIKCISIVSTRRRISSLEEDGEWLEALALALDHYESTVVSQEDKRRDQTGRKDLSRHPEFSGPKSDDEEWIAKLLIRYINLAVDNAPESSPPQVNDYSPARGGSQMRIDLAQSHFQMLAGVCVEFCVTTRRLDLLFGSIFQRFHSVGYTSVFLDVLEPYVLSDKLLYIAPEVMAFFVDHCKATNGIATVERCLLHLDVTIMDFDTILSLLRANEMYSALFYVFNQGLSDYVAPLEILLERVFDEADAGIVTKTRRRDGTLQTPFEKCGYKALWYLQTCFLGKTFPQEKELLPEERKVSVREELMSFLTRDNFQPSPHFKRHGSRSLVGQRALLYPYMRLLLLVDPKVMFDTVSLAIDAPDANISRSLSADDWVDENASSGENKMPDKQEIMTVLASIVLPTPGGLESLIIQSPSLVNAFLDFTAKYLLTGAVHVNKEIVFMIVRRMADRFASSKDPANKEQAQRQILELLSALPRDSYEPDKVLDLIGKANIHRAALLLHQQVALPWHEDSTKDIQRRSYHFSCAIDCYLEDHDVLFRREVFDYVKKECSGVVNTSDVQPGEEPRSLRGALYAKLPALVHLDALMTARLVAELFVDDIDRVVQSLESDSDDGKALFRFFQAIISGDLLSVDPVAGSVLVLTMEHHHRYLALMAKLHPEMVYDYLSSHDNYRPEECLKLCQEYDIADASAYLLERLGNVSSALQLILQTLESRMMNLKRTIRGVGIDVFRTRHLLQSRKMYGLSTELTSSQAKDVDRVKKILVVALDLCERNSGTLSTRSEHGSQLWFNVLDRLINAKGFLRLSKEQPEHAKMMAGVLSELLQLTMQRMVSSVPLTDLVRKVTSDHSGSRLSDLREMVESLLGTFGFELSLFEGAISVFHQDVYMMQNHHRSLRLEASPVRSVLTVPLISENSATIKGYLRKSSHLDVALQVGKNGNAALVDDKTVSCSRRVESGLGSALSKLRSRRGGMGAAAKPALGGSSRRATASSRSGLNMMPITEQLYQHGETEPVVYGARPVGALGPAEHRGRLMTFS